MKKILFVLSAIVLALMMVSCTNTKKEASVPEVKWNVSASVTGEGRVVVGFPTGDFTVAGNAELSAHTANDTLSPVDTLTVNDVLSAPEMYDQNFVSFAENLRSAFYVKVLEGKWKAKITGYVKWDKIYLLFDEEYPKDSVAVAVADTVAVE